MLIVCRKLTWPSINALNLQRQPVHLVFQHLQPSGFPGHQRKSTGVDLLAAFTNGLIKQWTREKEKTSKQQSTTSIEEKEVDKLLENINILYDDIDVRRLDAKQLDDHILQALENKEYEIFQHTIDQCSKYKKLPSTEVLKRIFPLLCISEYNNALSTTAKLIYTCEQQRVNLFDEQPMLKPFHAQRLWYNGQLVEALEHLKGLLKHSDSNVKKNILQNYRRIVQDTLANHSEAIIINLVDHAASILDEYNDLTVVELIWMNCFSSDWFSDQQMANDIFKKHELLRQTVGARCSLITSSLLYQHNISAIYRLIEQFLAFKMKYECSIIMELLFMYQSKRGNKRACKEIKINADKLGIKLSRGCEEKLLYLLLGMKPSASPKKEPPENFNSTSKFKL